MIAARSLSLVTLLALLACARGADAPPAEERDEPSPVFRNVATTTAYVGDSACTSCHATQASAYAKHAMSRSFHAWTSGTRVEAPLDSPLVNRPTGFSYKVVERDARLYQVEYLEGPDGKRLHELERRIDWVMGSGNVARTYFTEENGRLFQLPLTWYDKHGWDFSPGYEVNDARFDRTMPDRCVACHSSYPAPKPYLEGKYETLRSGIGCERCHGPGALHVRERRASAPRDSGFDRSIVNPVRLPLERRLDLCEQCHVHTSVNVLREGKTAFSYMPSEPLRDTWAFFKTAGSIDVVSHADRLRQSRCFLATRGSARPLECATCHDPHAEPLTVATRNARCATCHTQPALQQKLARSASLADHAPKSDCVSCHMPRIQEKTVPHGTFTEHWIRVRKPNEPQPVVRRSGSAPIEAFFARDRGGVEAPVYQGMGTIVYATLANDGRALGDGATTLRRALASDTSHHAAQFLLGVAEQQLGRTDEAIRTLERTIRSESNRPEALRALAQSYLRAGRSLDTVAPLYERALSLQPALAWIRVEYADVLQASGRREAAVRAYREALAEEPSLGVAWFNLGAVLTEDVKLAESAKAFQEAVHLDPSVAQALAPLVAIRTTGKTVTGIKSLGIPIASMPVRERGPRAVRMSVPTESDAKGVVFLNVPPRAVVRIERPDGTPLRTLKGGDGFAIAWDMLDDRGEPVASGLYRTRVQARDDAGRVRAVQFFVGFVRQRSEDEQR